MKRSRQVPGWSVLVTALIIAVVAAAAISALRWQADKMRQAEILLIRLEAQANRLSSLEDRAISEQELAVKVAEEVQAVRSQTEQIFDQVTQLAPSGQNLQLVYQSYDRYITATDEEFRLIQAGQFAQARAVDEQRVDPSFAVFSQAIATISTTYHDTARRTLQQADQGSALTLITAAVAIGLLFWRFNQAQRQAELQLVRAEQRVLRQNEERFRSLVQNASDVILILAEDRTIRYASASLYRNLGYQSEDWVRTNLLNWVHPDHAPQLPASLSECLSNPGVTPAIALQLQHHDGHWCWVEAIGNNRLSDSSVGGIVVNFRDITERKRSEAELRTFVEQLERSNRELEDFARVASHDLQEPLRKIQAFGDRLQARCSEALSDQGRDYLERMQQAAHRMQTLINDLLTFSRVTTKAQPFVTVNLTTVAQAVLVDLEVRIEQTGGYVKLDELPMIEADPLQMRQLLQNLIVNALKFHRNGEPPVVKLRSQSHPELNPGNYPGSNLFCSIIVEDNGIGFDQKYLDRIFTVFQRLHGRTEYSGSGVGLAICRKIAERHNGSITANSTPGQGATFIVTLPLTQANSEYRP